MIVLSFSNSESYDLWVSTRQVSLEGGGGIRQKWGGTPEFVGSGARCRRGEVPPRGRPFRRLRVCELGAVFASLDRGSWPRSAPRADVDRRHGGRPSPRPSPARVLRHKRYGDIDSEAGIVSPH